jgi:branched-chain amino acid transport system substrate-binding protein
LGKTILTGVRDVLGAEHAGALVKEASYEVAEPTVDSKLSRCRAPASTRSLSRQPRNQPRKSSAKFMTSAGRRNTICFSARLRSPERCRPAGLEKCKGLITAGYQKDPTVPIWQDDPGFKEWAAFATKYMNPTDVRDGRAAYGFTAAATMVHVLEQCGDDLSRENILRQALAIKDLELPMLSPGIKINTSPDNYFLIRQLQLEPFNGDFWEPFGELISC